MDLSQLSNATTAIGALSGLILVSPQDVVGYQPQNPPGVSTTPPDAMLFDYEGENTVSLESDITDHPVEDNSMINDQISLRPEVITVRGYIGELNDIPPNKALKLLKTAAERLTNITAYTPQLSESAIRAYNEAYQLWSVGQNAYNSAVSAIDGISNLINDNSGQNVISSNGLSGNNAQNKQQTAFQKFYGYWRERRLFTVQTPWAVFENMAIKNLRAIQDEDTAVISGFEVTFKMVRYAGDLTKVVMQGRADAQSADLINLGTSTPSISDKTFSSILSAV